MGQFADPDPRQPELAEVAAGSAVDGVAVAHPHRAGVAGLARQLVLCRRPSLGVLAGERMIF